MGERGRSGMERQMIRGGENGNEWMDGWGCNGLRVTDDARNGEKQRIDGSDEVEWGYDRDRK